MARLLDPSRIRRHGFLLSLLLCGASAVAIACGSSDEEGTEGGGGSSDAKKIFEKVYPSVVENCGSCHQTGKSGAPVFLGANVGASYTAIETFPGLLAAPSISPLVQKGAHSGPALTATQTDLVTQWLNAEVKARKLSADPGAPKNLRAAFAAFGKCMDYDQWKALKLHTMALAITENNRGPCRSCHNYGQASLWLNGGTDNPQDEALNAESFLKMREFPYVQRLVVGRVNAEGSFEGVEASRRIVDKGTESQQQQANSHPRYALSSDLAANLNTYVLETISNMNAGRCQNVVSPEAGLDGGDAGN